MFHKQNARQPLAAVLLAVLLALTSAFSCIGLSGWASFQRQLSVIDSQYTTVAYSTGKGTWALEPGRSYQMLDDGSYQDVETGTVIPSAQRISNIAQEAPSLLSWNTSVLAAAYTPNQKGFSSGSADPMAYNFAYDVHRYSQSVMAVRCVSVEENPYLGGGYLYHLEWVEPVCRMDAYDLPEQGKGFTFYGSSVVPTLNVSEDAEGTRPFPSFEVGKTYLIRGISSILTHRRGFELYQPPRTSRSTWKTIGTAIQRTIGKP